MTQTDSLAVPVAFARAADDVPVLSLARLGVTIRTLISTADSKGALMALEYTAPPRFRGPAPHWHATLTEFFIGVAGAPVVWAGDGTHRLTAGSIAVVPPRVMHGFSNPGDEPATFLVLASPGMGLEGYFPELARLIGDAATWPPTDPAVLSAVATLAARYDTFGGPTPGGPTER